MAQNRGTLEDVPQLANISRPVILDETRTPVLRVRSGVVVASSVDGAIDAREGGLAAGDVIYAVNRTPVTGLANLRTVLDGSRAGDPVVLQLERRGELMYLALTVE